MPCRMVVEGELVTLRVALGDSRSLARQRGRSVAARADEFPEIFHPTKGSEEEPDTLRKELEDGLTDDARRLLASEDVTVTVTWEQGSLEVAALVACGKIVADIGAFLAGLRHIRELFPERIRERISAWLGRDVAMRRVHLDIDMGLLHGKAEEPSERDGASETRPFSVKELRWYAVLSLIVLVVVAGLVIGGAALLI